MRIMSDWRYIDKANVVAFRTLDDGRIESVLASALPIGTQILPYVQTPEQIKMEIVNAVQNRLDTFAQTRNYDGILSACTYATSTVPKFAADGQYAVNARDAAWATCYQIMTDVQAGTRPLPTVEQVLSELPALVWPN
jgi:hypothetical protein